MSVVIVMGKASHQKVHRGTVRLDKVKVDGVELVGFLRTVKRNGDVVKSTHFYEEIVDGHDTNWLVEKNVGRSVAA